MSRVAARPWTCSSCRGLPAAARSFALVPGKRSSRGNSSHGDGPRTGSGRASIYASVGVAWAFSDEIKGNYEAVARTGRVAAGLAVCINE